MESDILGGENNFGKDTVSYQCMTELRNAEETDIAALFMER